MGLREWSEFVVLVLIVHWASVVVTAPVWGIALMIWDTPQRRKQSPGNWERRILVAVVVLIPVPLTIWALQGLAASY